MNDCNQYCLQNQQDWILPLLLSIPTYCFLDSQLYIFPKGSTTYELIVNDMRHKFVERILLENDSLVHNKISLEIEFNDSLHRVASHYQDLES